ncbi:MAG TPA: TlpA disulfide reductase family protein [bacterium]|nr:TlpA disulfide reductase family protein [bacterium]
MQRIIVLALILSLTPAFALTDDDMVSLLVDLYTSSYTGRTEGEIFASYGTTEAEMSAYYDSLPAERQDEIVARMQAGYYAFMDSRFEDFYGKGPALFTAPSLGGEPYMLAEDLGDKVLFINVFATWCPPCEDEIPNFVALIEEYGGAFGVVGVSVDDYLKVDDLDWFAKEHGINYPLVLYTQTDEEAQGYYSADSIPTTWIVDPEGLVQKVIVGSRPKEEFKEIIDSYLAGD